MVQDQVAADLKSGPLARTMCNRIIKESEVTMKIRLALFLRILFLTCLRSGADELPPELKALFDPKQSVAGCVLSYPKNANIGIYNSTNGRTVLKAAVVPNGYYIQYLTNWGLPSQLLSTERGDRYWVGESATEYWGLNGKGFLQVAPKVPGATLEDAKAAKNMLASQAVRDRVFLRGALALGQFAIDIRNLEWISKNSFRTTVGTLANPVEKAYPAVGIVDHYDPATGDFKISLTSSKNGRVVYESTTTGRVRLTAGVSFEALTSFRDERFPADDPEWRKKLHSVDFIAQGVQLQLEDQAPQGYHASELVAPDVEVQQMIVHSNNHARYRVRENGVMVPFESTSTGGHAVDQPGGRGWLYLGTVTLALFIMGGVAVLMRQVKKGGH
jgi:hypothetical protein